MMRIAIYNPNSHGGSYEYSKMITNNLAKAGNDVTLYIPLNSDCNQSWVIKNLLPDKITIENKIGKRLFFIYRSFLNPLIFFSYVLKGKPNGIVINDFDQVSSFLWGPLFYLLKSKIKISIVLHDPNRDTYLFPTQLSAILMLSVILPAHVLFYHEYLPSKWYYNVLKRKYISIPHGIYSINKELNEKLANEITEFKQDNVLIGLIGNIRPEKNIDLVIKASHRFNKIKIIVAGNPATSNINVDAYYELVNQLNMTNRVFWMIKYLDDSEFHTVMELTDIFSLYYSSSFNSQSGLLNVFANYKKPILVSDTNSGMSMLTRKYNLGLLVKPDSESALEESIEYLLASDKLVSNWTGYLNYASWEENAKIIQHSLQ